MCVLRKVKRDNRFKPRAFLQVEKILEEKLPNNELKSSPHIELCVKTLKKQFNAIMDMLTVNMVAGFLGTTKRKWFYVIKIYLNVG